MAVQSSNDKDSILANIALLYYGEGLTQREIAKRMGVSRATVVNYLNEGRERGIVDIRVKGNVLKTSNLSRDLCSKFGLQDAYVSYAQEQDNLGLSSSEEIVRQNSRVAAMALIDILEPGDKLGVAWGETIKNIAHEIPKSKIDKLTVCQMIGAMDSERISAAETCAIQVANHLGATCYTLHAPAVVSSAELARAIQNEPTIAQQLKRLENLDAALFSVGDMQADTLMVSSGIATDKELKRAIDKGACGIICARYYDDKGNNVSGQLDERLIAISFDDLKKIPKRILVVSGEKKFSATLGALSGGLVSHLCIDSILAEKLLDD